MWALHIVSEWLLNKKTQRNALCRNYLPIMWLSSCKKCLLYSLLSPVPGQFSSFLWTLFFNTLPCLLATITSYNSKAWMLLVFSGKSEAEKGRVTPRVRSWSGAQAARSPFHVDLAAEPDAWLHLYRVLPFTTQSTKEVFKLCIFAFNMFSNVQSRKSIP